MPGALMSGWQVQRLRESAAESLGMIEKRIGFEVKNLRNIVNRITEDELVELFTVLDTMASLIDHERKLAHGIVSVEDFVKFAKRLHGTKRRPK